MEQESRGRRQVDIFNFSFLDILACVIGLLIFILTIVVISGGGSSSTKRADRVAEAEHHLTDARAAAELASARRSRVEAMLVQRADQVIDPVAAAENVQKQNDLFDRESQELSAASARLDKRVADVRAALAAETKSANDAQVRLKTAQTETAMTEQRIVTIEAQTSKVSGTKKPQKDVPFYVARVHDTDRKQVWIELSGDRIYFLMSDDFRRSEIDESSTRFDRVESAQGMSVAALTTGKADIPELLSIRPASQTVISILLRPDGFAAFRKLRDWAWEKGYAVYWLPTDVNEPLELTRGRAQEQ